MILKKATLVTTVSQGLVDYLNQYDAEVLLLRNGIHQLHTPTPSAVAEYFTISYTGSVYPLHQKPQLLLTALKNLIEKGKIDSKEIRFIYAGKDELVWRKWIKEKDLTSIFVNRGLVSIKEAIQLQHDSHVNLLLSWASEKMSGILTGKFYEYLAAQHPILLIINGSVDREFENIFQQLNAGKIVYHPSDSTVDLEAFILEKYKKWQVNKLPEKVIPEEALAPFKWENQVVEFLNLLQKKS